jgi:hypothetical protein
MSTPSQLYQSSPRAMPGKLPAVEYPDRFEVRYVSANRGVRWHKDRIPFEYHQPCYPSARTLCHLSARPLIRLFANNMSNRSVDTANGWGIDEPPVDRRHYAEERASSV